MIAEIRQKECIAINSIEQNKVVAVVRTTSAQKAIDISKALIDGGIKSIEITMSYPNAPSAIKEISSIEGITVAAGSVITNYQVEGALEAGAQLIVSPVSEMSLIKFCRGRKINIITSASTPNEAYNAWKLGVNLITIFPAKALGGADYIKDILTPMRFLRLLPTGGITADTFTDYLKAGAVAVGMGKALYGDEKKYSAITQKAKTLTKKLEDYLQST